MKHYTEITPPPEYQEVEFDRDQRVNILSAPQIRLRASFDHFWGAAATEDYKVVAKYERELSLGEQIGRH